MNTPLKSLPSKDDLNRAREIIAPYIHQTPVITSLTLNKLSGASLFFKCENFQKAGAFKFRGASHAIATLPAEQHTKGVSTHSSGNHAQALALAARNHGIKAYIVMPENAPRIKVEAVKDYGGKITFCQPTLQDREATLKEVIKETGAVEIHPYNNYTIIAGQASAAAELFGKVGAPDCIVVPVGGGGLLSGSILSSRYFSPQTKVYGAEPLMANDAWESFRKKEFIPSKNPQTIADGLRTSLGSKTFPIIMQGAEDILTAREETIIRAMYLIWERMKIVVEPSAAVALAVVLENPEIFKNRKTGLILSGGNVDLTKLPWLENRSFNKH